MPLLLCCSNVFVDLCNEIFNPHSVNQCIKYYYNTSSELYDNNTEEGHEYLYLIMLKHKIKLSFSG